MENREGERLFEEVIKSSWDVIFEDGILKLPDEETIDQKGIDINDVEQFGEEFAEQMLVCVLRGAIRFRLANYVDEEPDGDSELLGERIDFDDYREVLRRMVEPMLNREQKKVFEYGMDMISGVNINGGLCDSEYLNHYNIGKICDNLYSLNRKDVDRSS